MRLYDVVALVKAFSYINERSILCGFVPYDMALCSIVMSAISSIVWEIGKGLSEER